MRDLTEDSLPCQREMIRCPFLRNINEPTNLSFASSMALPLPVRGAAKGPIFEDGPNFDMAFRLFHGRDGVVPLSGKAYVHPEEVVPERSSSQFNPLAAKAATISLSSFGPGGPFSFDAFNGMWKSQQKKSSKKDNSSKNGDSSHEALSNEWLRTGQCPIAKSFRAVSGVIPLVAKVLKPPPGVNLKCPPAIVAARAALARTAFAKNLRPQPLPEKILVIGALGMAANIPLGMWREHTKKFSPSWFVAIHAAIPFIGMLRKVVLMPKTAMAFTIGASVLGQVIGSRAERYRLKAKVTTENTVKETSITIENNERDLPAVTMVNDLPAVTMVNDSNRRARCGPVIKWDPLAIGASGPHSSASICV